MTYFEVMAYPTPGLSFGDTAPTYEEREKQLSTVKGRRNMFFNYNVEVEF
jgi:hypothetical protein